MASGNTTTDALAESLPTVRSSARIIREYEGVMQRLVDGKTLGEGIGLSWHEISLAALTASAINETTELDNPQQLSDTLFSITPSMVAIHTVITDRVGARISKNAFAQTGSLAQNAIERKKDIDGLTVLDGATTVIAGAGTTLTSGHISAAASRIRFGAANEPSNPPLPVVLHSYQFKDLFDEATAGYGTYPMMEGQTARVFQEGFKGQIDGAMLFEDNNTTIISGDDVKGGAFAKEAIVLVQGRSPRTIVLRNEKLGGGATELIIYDEYAYGERSSGNWLYEIQSDATAPTS